MLEYEHESEPPQSSSRFVLRVLWHGAVALALVAVSMLAGMIGFHVLEGHDWLDSYLNAAMLLGGMGQVGAITPAGREDSSRRAMRSMRDS